MLILVTILLFTSSVFALKCYTCNSLQRRNCDDPFDPPDTEPLSLEYITDCNMELERKKNEKILSDYLVSNIKTNHTYFCRKIVHKVETSKIIVRKCGWLDQEDNQDKCVTKTGSSGPSTYCTCTKDLCNHSNDLIFNIFTFLIPIHLSLAFMRLKNHSI